jgi:hypothetical protein
MSSSQSDSAYSFVWQSFETPLRETHAAMDGSTYDLVWPGALKVEWDSPTGRFVLMMPMHNDPTPNLDDLRPMLMNEVQAAYVAATS